jgi:short-subunit dehydrogenase
VNKSALLIGNSDGIGLEVTRRLLESGWCVTGISKSDSPIIHESYRHIVSEVQNADFPDKLHDTVAGGSVPDLCIYCAGIGELLDTAHMEYEVKIVEVNLLGMVKTASVVIPEMIDRGRGHFIGLSSLADVLLSAEAPSYHASKAGFSSYLESLALAVKKRGVDVTNIRFGFVDTKMAKGDAKPFMMTVARAAAHVLLCVEKKPNRYTAPRIAIPLVNVRRSMLRRKLG